jgi:hypothetical protein
MPKGGKVIHWQHVTSKLSDLSFQTFDQEDKLMIMSHISSSQLVPFKWLNETKFNVSIEKDTFRRNAVA